MNKYQRENQVSVQELNQFKQSEINQIFEKARQSSHQRVLMPKLVFSLMMLIVIAIIAFIGLKEPTETGYPNNIEVTQLSHNTYLATSILNGETFHLYYQSHIVYKGEEVILNDTFNYKMNYVYVPDEIAKEIDVEFNIFQVDDYRYFVYSKALGEELFFEFDFFYETSRSLGFGSNMDFVDFEEDIRAVFQLIDQYPPVYQGTNQYNMHIYEGNENVYEVEDDRLVSNYVYYVEHYYRHENIDEETSRDESATIFVENIIILDESNNILANIASTDGYNRIVTLDEQENHVEASFTYIVKNIESQPSRMYYELNDPIYGEFSFIYIDDDIYGYTVIQLNKADVDLTDTVYVKYLYDYGSYHQDGEISVTVDAFVHSNNLVTKPYLFSSDNRPRFRNMTIEFYNESDTLIYSYDMNQE